MLAQRAPQESHVQALDVQGHIGQCVVGNEVEGHIGVAKGEVEIDQGGVVLGVLSQRGAEVDGDAGAADPAARAQDGDDLGLDLGTVGAQLPLRLSPLGRPR